MHLLPHILSLFVLLPISATAQYQFYNFTTAATNLSSTCVAVLNQAVTCDPALGWAGMGRFEDDATLSAVCTSTCATSLATWLRRALGAGTTRYVDRTGNALLPAYFVESVLENYNVLCLKNGDQLCNSVLRVGFGVDPDNQSKTRDTGKEYKWVCEEHVLMYSFQYRR
jgi:hypothetical protein